MKRVLTDTKKKTVLHVTPHLGGGVGSVLLNYLTKTKEHSDFEHSVLSLEYANEKAQMTSRSTGFPLKDKMAEDYENLLHAISLADVVLIHWWNHPLLYTFLVRESLPPARIIFWSHISGFHPPYVFTQPVLNYPDLFVFTSPLSFDTPDVKELSEERKENLRVIWSTGGVEQTALLKQKIHSSFNVGYIGTVDYSKMHPRFLKMSAQIEIPNVRFIVCGGPNENQISKEARQYVTDGRFTFTGPVDRVYHYLELLDVFGYPLAPYHYGTCEQSLGESMAAGVPPVVLANKTESYIVENGVTGLVVQNEDDYHRAIEELYQRPDLLKRLSDNARTAAQKRYSIDLMFNHWESTFHELLHYPKTSRYWTGKHRGKHVSPGCVFIESLGDYGKPFEDTLLSGSARKRDTAMDQLRELYSTSRIWNAGTRGTANHYYHFFPEDLDLKIWHDTAIAVYGSPDLHEG
jgi:L-malate glycosyltransferase